MDQLLLCHAYPVEYFLDMRIVCFAFGEYLAEEVDWTLSSLYMAFFLSLDYHCNANHLSGSCYI